MTIGRFVIVAFLALLAGFGAAIIASAHAEPERAIPPINGEIESAPDKLEIWFSEEVTSETVVLVQTAAGDRVDLGTTELDLQDPDRKHVIVALQPNLPAATYAVEWTSISGEDGDTDTGTFTFTVLVGIPMASPVASPVAATPVASPSAATPVAGMTLGQANPEVSNDAVDGRAFLIALSVGVVAALLIFGFWILVKPRGDEIVDFSSETTDQANTD